MLSPQEIKIFQQKILSWYAKNKRDLPWRKDRNPYHILVSEVMLQQTQVSRVIPKYEEWMRKFPTIESLAKASTQEVLFHWSGLGYNRRALYLKKCAEDITEKYNGKIPDNEKKLLQLSGIGKYTAAALLCFAFNKQIPVIDTNVRKVILTQFSLNYPEQSEESQKGKIASRSFAMTEKKIEKIALQFLPKGKAYEWNQALMDYAAAELKHEKITIPKQSKFKDSDRFYRGQIIKLLTIQGKVSIAVLQRQFATLGKERLEKILNGLVKDNFIQLKNNFIFFYNT